MVLSLVSLTLCGNGSWGTVNEISKAIGESLLGTLKFALTQAFYSHKQVHWPLVLLNAVMNAMVEIEMIRS